MSDTSHKIENTLFRKYFKLTLFSLIPLLFLAFVLEISARVVYFQMKAQDTFGLTIVYKTIKNIYLEKKAHSIIRDNVFDNLQSDRLTKEQIQALYSETGEELLREIHSRIEKNLYNILTTAGKIQSKLVVLYLPSDIENDKNRLFFEDVCRQYGIDFLDVIPILSEYGQDYYKLLPENDHLSRFGNKIVAEAIGQFITSTYDNYTSSHRFPSRPEILGGLPPDLNEIWPYHKTNPYRMITNSQGFRMDRDIEFPKKKQRILLIGSSLTWGPYVENHDTYPDLLNKAYPKKECINGGKIGRTIVNDPSAFENHYRYCEPDITFLQVSSFDIETSLSFIQNMYLEKPIEPTVTEVKFIKAVINE